MKTAAKTQTIATVTHGRTYYGTADTELTAPGYRLGRGDIPRRWLIVDEATNKAVALLSI